MSTVAELYRDIGTEIGDEGNARVPTWKLLRWINKAIRDIVRKTYCLSATLEVTGSQEVEIVGYSALSGETVTVTVDGTASVLTEGVGWTAATSNAATATSLATAVNAVTGLSAYADSLDTAVVVIVATGGYGLDTIALSDETNTTTSATGRESLELENILTRFRLIENVYSTADEIIYRSYTRQQYDRLITNDSFDGYGYTVNEANRLFIKRDGSNLGYGNSVFIDYYQWNATLTAASESPPGIIDDFDDAIVNRCMRQHMLNQRADNPKLSYETVVQYDTEYRQWIKDIKNELRSQGKPLEQRFLYQWK